MNIYGLGRPIEILLVEDNPGDVRLIQESLKDTKLLSRLSVANDGEEALASLHRQGRYADTPFPDLVLLDLNLPKMHGREVLAEIKSDGRLRRIPVVILTSSSAEEDILKTYDLYANWYITKPVNPEQLTNLLRVNEEFWFTLVKLPST